MNMNERCLGVQSPGLISDEFAHLHNLADGRFILVKVPKLCDSQTPPL